jgi:hypothetical protein
MSDWATIRPDSIINVNGSIHFAFFIQSSFEIGKVGKEPFLAPHLNAILRRTLENVHGASMN